jgi:hypothetical protein
MITVRVSERCRALSGVVGDIIFVFREELNEQAIAVITAQALADFALGTAVAT